MQAAADAPTTIDDYIASFPPAVQVLLQTVRVTIQKAAPEATEAIKYRLPTFVLQGNLVHFGAFSHHVGLYPGAAGVARFRSELAGYVTSKGAIQFPFDRRLPVGLIRKIVRSRRAEALAKSTTNRKGRAARTRKT
ncbi:MAG: DUF1801 domain-containing protein [Opitutaceae bacterium]|nr:DUF1801 domain-containing protein [Opitutaceae bacterium]